MNMGSKALSHDSVFVSDLPASEETQGLGASQDSIQGKVKSLQVGSRTGSAFHSSMWEKPAPTIVTIG